MLLGINIKCKLVSCVIGLANQVLSENPTLTGSIPRDLSTQNSIMSNRHPSYLTLNPQGLVHHVNSNRHPSYLTLNPQGHLGSWERIFSQRFC